MELTQNCLVPYLLVHGRQSVEKKARENDIVGRFADFYVPKRNINFLLVFPFDLLTFLIYRNFHILFELGSTIRPHRCT